MIVTLWTQSKSPTIPDEFVIDGRKEVDTLSPTQQERFKKLLKYSNKKGYHADIVRELYERGEIESSEFKIYKESSSFFSRKHNRTTLFIPGHYTTLDDSKRRIPFMFLYEATGINIDQVLVRLKEDSEKVGRDLSSTDLKVYKYIYEYVPRKRSIKLVIILIISFFLFISIFIFNYLQ